MTISTELERLEQIREGTQREIEALLEPHLQKWIQLHLILRKISDWAEAQYFDFSSIEDGKAVYKTNDRWQGESIVLEIPMEFINDRDKYIMSSLSEKEISVLTEARKSYLENLKVRRAQYVDRVNHSTHQLEVLKSIF